MFASNWLTRRHVAIASLALCMCATWPTESFAQRPRFNNCGFFNNQRSVGGVLINGDVVDDIKLDEKSELIKIRREALEAIGGDAKAASKMRFISLRRLQDAIEAKQKEMLPLSDEMYYLAGLQRIEYVFAVPEQKDIIIAGPAEAWLI